MTRRKHQSIATEDADFIVHLDQQIDPTNEHSALFDLQFSRQMFLWASERVREQVTSNTWLTFWKTTVDGQSVTEAAAELSMSTGAVHIARSRVLGRLRLEVIALEEGLDEGTIQRSAKDSGEKS